MGCGCTKIPVQVGRTYYVDKDRLLDVTGLSRAQAGGSISGLALPMLGFGLLGGGLAKATGASWLLAGGIAVAFPIAVVVALGLAARSGSASARAMAGHHGELLEEG